MYFRKKTSGGRAYLQIVESRRDGGQVRQQVIATLGRYEDLRESGPGKLAGKRIDVYRVELDQCRKCGHLMPTPEGQSKVKRCVKKGREFFLNNLH